MEQFVAFVGIKTAVAISSVVGLLFSTLVFFVMIPSMEKRARMRNATGGEEGRRFYQLHSFLMPMLKVSIILFVFICLLALSQVPFL